MIRHLLVDYGEVISAPLAGTAITELAALADQPRAVFLDRYWRYRPAYDLGQSATGYWSRVLDADLGGSPWVVDRLTSTDVQGWLGLNPLTLSTVQGHASRAGARLALLSNAPEPLARAIDHLPWSQRLEQCYYSCRLGAAKPDPSAFLLVTSECRPSPSPPPARCAASCARQQAKPGQRRDDPALNRVTSRAKAAMSRSSQSVSRSARRSRTACAAASRCRRPAAVRVSA
jgi:putative hydrolase of the HAD superfamily